MSLTSKLKMQHYPKCLKCLKFYHVFPIDCMCSLAFILSEAMLVFRGSASSSENLSINPEHWYADGGGHTAPMWGRGWLSVDELRNCGGV